MLQRHQFRCLVFSLAGSLGAYGSKFVCPVVWKDRVFAGLELFQGPTEKRAQLKPDNGDDPLPHFWSLEGKNFWVTCLYRPLGAEAAPIEGRSEALKGAPKNCLTEKATKDEGVYRVINCE